MAEGLSLRLDTYRGTPDISFYRSSRTTASLFALGPPILNALSEELRVAGFDVDNPRKITLMLYDADDTGCGVGGGSRAFVAIRNCGESTIIHEFIHATGNLRAGDPSWNGDGHSNDPRDFMYKGAAPADERLGLLDPGRDDYWHEIMPYFAVHHHPLHIKIHGLGNVEVDIASRLNLSSAERGCRLDCTKWYRTSDVVTLTAWSGNPRRPVQWEGACTGTAPECRVTMREQATVTARFVWLPPDPRPEPAPDPEAADVAIKVRVIGPGTVRVLGRTLCSKRCTYWFSPGHWATLRAKPKKGATLIKWQGGCISKPRPKLNCRLRVRQDRRSITARFTRR